MFIYEYVDEKSPVLTEPARAYCPYALPDLPGELLFWFPGLTRLTKP